MRESGAPSSRLEVDARDRWRAMDRREGQHRLFSMHVSAIKCIQSAPLGIVLLLSHAQTHPPGPPRPNHITVVRITPPRLVLWPLFPIQCPHCWGVIAYTLNPLCLPRILYHTHLATKCMLHAYTHPSNARNKRKKNHSRVPITPIIPDFFFFSSLQIF